jgi:hypothetical protein
LTLIVTYFEKIFSSLRTEVLYLLAQKYEIRIPEPEINPSLGGYKKEHSRAAQGHI